MKRTDRIKLDFTRNWKLPGKERLSHWFKPSSQLKTNLKNGIVWLTDEDIAIYTNADSYIEWSILSNGTYEDEIGKLIRISVPHGGVALDVGGNIGLQSIRMAQAAGPQGKIFAFEPLQHLQEKFKSNVRLNNINNVTLMPYALSDNQSEADFSINTDSWNQGTFSINDANNGTTVQRVIIKIADELPEIKALPRLDLIKIDVEGFEFQVLRGLKQTLVAHKPRIIFEYDSNYWLKTGQLITECFSFLQVLNYVFYQITPVGCERIDNSSEIKGGNIFCINE